MTDNTKQKRTESQVEHSKRAAWVHGLRSAFAEGRADDTALPPEDRSRLAELREILTTRSGALGLLTDMTAQLSLLADVGMAALREIAERDGPARAFQSEIMPNVQRAMAAHRRAVECLARLDTGGRR